MRSQPLILCAPLLAAACMTEPELGQTDDAITDDCRPGDHRHVRIAWLGNDPANTYDNANLDAARAVATAAHSTVTPSYAGFDPSVQLSQCLDAVRSHRYDAVIVIPDDSVGIVECVHEAAWRRIPVVASDLPIGADLTTVEPQVRGEAGAVLVPAADWGDKLSALLGDACASRTPCDVAYIAGSFGVAFDQIALDDLDALAAANPNIRIVHRDEAFYDSTLAYDVTQTILADAPDVDLIVGAGDQMAQGAERALADSGRAPGSVLIVGAGAGAYAVQAVRDGRWYATYVALPADEGDLAARIAIDAARRRPILERGIDPVARRGFPSFFTLAAQGAFVGFVPQWPG